jgi:hypothetical protein
VDATRLRLEFEPAQGPAAVKLIGNTVEEVLESLWRMALLAFMVVLILIGLRVYMITMPKIDAEIDEAHRASTEAALTAMETRKLGVAANKALPVTIAKVDQAIDGVTAATASAKTALDAVTTNTNAIGEQAKETLKTLNSGAERLGPLLDGLNKTTVGLQPTETALTAEIQSLNSLTTGLTKAVNDPAVHQTAQNVARGTHALADMADDTEQKVHSIFHPRWPAQVADWVERIGTDVAKVMY